MSALVADRGSQADVTSGTTTLVDMAAAASITVGNFLIARVAVDNAGTNGAAPGVTVTDARNGTWTVLGPGLADPGAANAGSTVYVAYVRVDAAYTNGDDVTFTWGVSLPAKAVVVEEWSGIHPTAPVAVAATTANGSSTTPSAARTPTASGQLVYGAITEEAPNADGYTEDTDTTQGSWVALTRLGSTDATATNNQKIVGAYKLVQGTSAQTWNPTLGTSRDWAELLVVFAEGVPARVASVAATARQAQAQLTIPFTKATTSITARAATVTTSWNVSVSAGCATIGAAAQGATTKIEPHAGAAAIAAAAQAAVATAGRAPAATAATVTTAAQAATVTTATNTGSRAKGLVLSGGYADTPDSATWTVSGVLRMVLRVSLTDWTPQANNELMSHAINPTNRSLQFLVTTAGALADQRSSNGANTFGMTQAPNTPFVDGTIYWVGWEYTTSTGALVFYINADTGDNVPPTLFSGWSESHSLSGTALTPFDSTAPLAIGANGDGSAPLSGTIYRAQFYDDGVLIADPDFTPWGSPLAVPGSSTYTDSVGNVWTLHGAAEIPAIVLAAFGLTARDATVVVTARPAAGNASLAVAGQNATVTHSDVINVAAGNAAAAVAGQNASVTHSDVISAAAAAASLAVAAQAATVTAAAAASAGNASLAVTAQEPTVLTGAVANAAAECASFGLAAQAATVVHSDVISAAAQAATLSVVSQAATTKVAPSAGAASVSLTARDATVATSTSAAAQAATFALTARNAVGNTGGDVAAAVVSVSLTARAATAVHADAVNAAAGAATVSLTARQAQVQLTLPFTKASFALTARNATASTFSSNVSAFAAVAAFGVTARQASVTMTGNPQAQTATFAVAAPFVPSGGHISLDLIQDNPTDFVVAAQAAKPRVAPTAGLAAVGVGAQNASVLVSSGNVQAAALVAGLSVTARTASTMAATNAAALVAGLTVAGQAAQAHVARAAQAAAATVAVAALNAVGAPLEAAPAQVAGFGLTARSAAVTTSTAVGALVAGFSVNGAQAGAQSVSVASAGSAAVGVAGLGSTVQISTSAGSGGLTVAGVDPSAEIGERRDADAGSAGVGVAGLDAAAVVSWVVSAAAGEAALGLVGLDATGSVTTSAETAPVSVAGLDAAVVLNPNVDAAAEAASFTVAGEDPTVTTSQFTSPDAEVAGFGVAAADVSSAITVNASSADLSFEAEDAEPTVAPFTLAIAGDASIGLTAFDPSLAVSVNAGEAAVGVSAQDALATYVAAIVFAEVAGVVFEAEAPAGHVAVNALVALVSVAAWNVRTAGGADAPLRITATLRDAFTVRARVRDALEVDAHVEDLLRVRARAEDQ